MSELLAFLGDFTLRNVMLGAALLGATSGVLGSFALLRQQSLLGDTLSHAALPGIALGFLAAGSRQLAPILAGALLTGALAAFAVLSLTRYSRLKSDAALGAVLSVFFAVGIVLLTFIGNQNDAGRAGLESFLFGQAATVIPSDVRLMLVIALVVLLVVLAFWKEFKVMTFDAGFAASLGLPLAMLELTLTVLIALAIVIGLQLVGVVLMASMIVAPAAAARQWSRTLEQMVFLSALFGAIAGVLGTLLSATSRGLATGPLIVIVVSVLVLASLLVAPRRGLLWQALNTRRTQGALQEQQVLGNLYQLARAHHDPAYPVESGMLGSYYEVNPRAPLGRLEQDGLIECLAHVPGEGLHWRLTAKGYRQAETHLEGLGQRAAG